MAKKDKNDKKEKKDGKSAPAAAIGNAVPVRIIKQYVKDISFENPNTPASVLTTIPEPDTSFKINVQARWIGDQGLAESVLMLRAEVRDKKSDRTVFIIEMAYGGVLSLQGIDEKYHKRILMVEAPRIMFPFVRHIVARVTMDGGYNPLYLNSIRFDEIFDAENAGEFKDTEGVRFREEMAEGR